MILLNMKESAELHLERTVTDVVLTVPPSFGYYQRQVIRDAGAISGLNVICIIDDATAAAIAYGIDKMSEEFNVLIFNLGGAMINVSLLTTGEGVFEVKATAGDIQLGGKDFDNRLVDHCIQKFRRENKRGDCDPQHVT